VISAHQAATVGQKDTKKVFIPTPNTTELSAEQYGKLYPERFRQPHSYIRSSATVEDCSGTSYCMSEADDAYLAKLNASRKPLPPITEDEFETIIDLYENAIQAAQPYLSMDVTNIIPFEELEHAFEDTLDANLRAAAKQIYPYWKEQKINRGGRTIIPCLKVYQFTSSCRGTFVLTLYSLNKGMRKMMVIHTFASADERFDKFARLVAQIPRAQTKLKS
jgi:enhancer of polycomb-like protein